MTQVKSNNLLKKTAANLGEGGRLLTCIIAPHSNLDISLPMGRHIGTGLRSAIARATITAIVSAAMISAASAQVSSPPAKDDPPLDIPATDMTIVECTVPPECPSSRFMRRPRYEPQGRDRYVAIIACSTPSIAACRIRAKLKQAAIGKKLDDGCRDATVIPFVVKGAFSLRVRVPRPDEGRNEPSCTVLGR